MRILELENLFKKEETLDKVLEELKADFDKTDYYANLMQTNIVNNPEEVKSALTELTGTFSNLRTALAIAETEKKNREIRAYNQIRIDVENAGKKFISASSEKQASGEVSAYRRIKNLILGYKESAEKAISSLQSILRYMAVEYNQNQ